METSEKQDSPPSSQIHPSPNCTLAFSVSTRKEGHCINETLKHCWFDVGPASQTLGQHQCNIVSTSRVYRDEISQHARLCLSVPGCLINKCALTSRTQTYSNVADNWPALSQCCLDSPSPSPFCHPFLLCCSARKFSNIILHLFILILFSMIDWVSTRAYDMGKLHPNHWMSLKQKKKHFWTFWVEHTSAPFFF